MRRPLLKGDNFDLAPIDPIATEVLVATLVDYQENGSTSMQAISRRTGRSTQTVQDRLRQLREAGLVRFEDGKAGTLRPAAQLVALA